MSEPVQLYRCKDCSRQRFQEELFHSGKGIILCKCGSRSVRAIVNPSFWDALVYLAHHPRRIPDYIREDVLGWS